MNHSNYWISLDINKIKSQLNLTLKQGETGRTIHISLTEDGRPYQISEGCYATFAARKTVNNEAVILSHNCTIQDNTIKYSVQTQTTAHTGLVECEIMLYSADGQLIISSSFSITVFNNTYSEVEDEAAEEMSTLAKLITSSNAIIQDVSGKLENGFFNAGFASEMGVTTTTGEAGTEASVTVTTDSKSSNKAKKFNFDFVIPKGDKGEKGGLLSEAEIRTTIFEVITESVCTWVETTLPKDGLDKTFGGYQIARVGYKISKPLKIKGEYRYIDDNNRVNNIPFDTVIGWANVGSTDTETVTVGDMTITYTYVDNGDGTDYTDIRLVSAGNSQFSTNSSWISLLCAVTHDAKAVGDAISEVVEDKLTNAEEIIEEAKRIASSLTSDFNNLSFEVNRFGQYVSDNRDDINKNAADIASINNGIKDLQDGIEENTNSITDINNVLKSTEELINDSMGNPGEGYTIRLNLGNESRKKKPVQIEAYITDDMFGWDGAKLYNGSYSWGSNDSYFEFGDNPTTGTSNVAYGNVYYLPVKANDGSEATIKVSFNRNLDRLYYYIDLTVENKSFIMVNSNYDYIMKLIYGGLEDRVTYLEQNGTGSGSTVELDTTLTEEGKAADAKAVGDALGNKVGFTDIATSSKLGIVKATGYGISVSNKGELNPNWATTGSITSRHQYHVLGSRHIDDLFKIGMTTNKYTLTDEEKKAAQAWLGIDEYHPLPQWITMEYNYGSSNEAILPYKISKPTAIKCWFKQWDDEFLNYDSLELNVTNIHWDSSTAYIEQGKELFRIDCETRDYGDGSIFTVMTFACPTNGNIVFDTDSLVEVYAIKEN